MFISLADNLIRALPMAFVDSDGRLISRLRLPFVDSLATWLLKRIAFGAGLAARGWRMPAQSQRNGLRCGCAARDLNTLYSRSPRLPYFAGFVSEIKSDIRAVAAPATAAMTTKSYH
jgi:hypothetical protein